MALEQAAAKAANEIDERLGAANFVKRSARKVFPDHWSFMLGEIALYSFIILLLTGTFLTLWFKPSQGPVVYEGSYVPLHGLTMSEAYASTLDISFDVRGGLIIRQIHHWAALIFVASMIVHMCRVFFTGAFRKPRETNWIIGFTLITLSFVEGLAGYSLPDDLLSGTGLRFVDGLIRSIPVVGVYLEFLVFGGEYPGDAIIPRLYIAHVLLIPGLLVGLISVHMLLLVFQKHTQWPGPGRTERNVVGYPILPVYAAKAGGFFFVVFGVTALLGGLFTINPIWNYGPYNPAEVTAGSQPDWYMGWVEGAVRIMPAWEFELFGLTWSMNVFIPAVLLLGLLTMVLAMYPFVERWVTKDEREHHLLQRPRDTPVRTALGVAGMTFYGLCWVGGGNDIIATQFRLDIYAITWFLRFAVFIGPVIAFIITKRICIALQRHDQERVLHGYETGVITRSVDGGYAERHAPIPQEEVYTLTSRDKVSVAAIESGTDENGVESPHRRSAQVHARASRFWHGDQVNPVTDDQLHDEHHDSHAELESADDRFRGVSETGIPKDH